MPRSSEQNRPCLCNSSFIADGWFANAWLKDIDLYAELLGAVTQDTWTDGPTHIFYTIYCRRTCHRQRRVQPLNRPAIEEQQLPTITTKSLPRHAPKQGAAYSWPWWGTPARSVKGSSLSARISCSVSWEMFSANSSPYQVATQWSIRSMPEVTPDEDQMLPSTT
jgi:hypothetical protein